MENLSKRATVYFDSELHRALKLKAAMSSRTLSEIVNDAIKNSLAEDADDLAVFETRSREPLVSYEKFVKELKKNGRL